MLHTAAAQGLRAGNLQKRKAANVGQTHVLSPRVQIQNGQEKKVWAGLCAGWKGHLGRSLRPLGHKEHRSV